ncbi:hypothetical protein MMC28_003576 [Mycoblastus sanguinarius]|nr:hypothetical protein [Mycoblastus sanguinarius]
MQYGNFRTGAHLNAAFQANGGLPLPCNVCKPNPRRSMFQPGSHKYPDLIDRVIVSFSQPSRNHTRRQREAKDAFCELQRTTDWTITAHRAVNIKAYAKVFDDFFFFGTICDRLDLELRTLAGNEDPCLNGLTKPVGECAMHHQIPRVLITLNASPQSCPPDPETRCQRILGTLLLELCHALLDLYGCKCHISLLDHLYFYGVDGHGTSWADLSFYVRHVAYTIFELDLDVDYHILDSLQEEERELVALMRRREGANDSFYWRQGVMRMAAEQLLAEP